MNSYESGQQKVIPAVLIYGFCGGDCLMLYRSGEGDFHHGKYNGLGGKLEVGESTRDAAAREWMEESGLEVEADRFSMLGQLHFPNFKPHRNEDWWVTVFTVQLTDDERGRVQPECPEGRLEWIDRDKVIELPTWEADRLFLPLVMSGVPFEGALFYRDKEFLHGGVRPLIAQ